MKSETIKQWEGKGLTEADPAPFSRAPAFAEPTLGTRFWSWCWLHSNPITWGFVAALVGGVVVLVVRGVLS